MMIPQLALTILVALSAATNYVDAHGKLLKPEARLRPGSKLSAGSQFDFVGEIEGKDVFSERNGSKLQWGRTPQKNQQQFAEMFAAGGYTTLRQFFQANDKVMKPRFPGKTDHVCGFTDMAATPSTLPADGVLEWGHAVGRWGFQDSHHGPCEVWCDDNLVLRNDDCLAAYGKKLPARIKIDVAKCDGAKRLQFLWLAVHFAKWQYWMNCVPLVVTTPAPTPVPTTPTPTNASTPAVPSPVATPSASGVYGPTSTVLSAVPVTTPSIAPSVVPSVVPSVIPATPSTASVATPPTAPTTAPTAVVPAVPPTQLSKPKPCPTTASPFNSVKQSAPVANSPRQLAFGA